MAHPWVHTWDFTLIIARPHVTPGNPGKEWLSLLPGVKKNILESVRILQTGCDCWNDNLGLSEGKL